MESRADVYGIGLLEKGKHFIRQAASGIQRAAVLLFGILLANVSLPGGLSPFGIAYAMAAPAVYQITAAIGAAIGYVFYFAGKFGGLLRSGISGVAWQYLCGLALALGIEKGGIKLFGEKHLQAVKFVGVFSAGVVPALAVSLLGRVSVNSLILIACQGAMAAGAFWLFQRAFRWINVNQANLLTNASPRDRPQSVDIASILLTAGLMSGALSRLCIGRVSIGRVLAMAAILLCSCRKSNGSGLGAAAGVTAGVLASLCGPSKGFGSFAGEALPGIWGIGGLLAGLFAPLGRGFCCAAMLLGETASIFLFAQDERMYILLAEAVAASILFLLIPAKAVNLTGQWLGGSLPGNGGAAVGELLLSRLHSAGSALADIARTTEAVSERLLERDLPRANSPDRIYQNTMQKVCRRCPDGMKCWTEHYSDTIAGISRLHHLLQKSEGTVDSRDVSACFSQGCSQPDKLAAQAERDFRENLAEKEKKRVSTRVRGVVTDQFEGLSMVVEGMARQMRDLCRVNPSLSKQIEEFCIKSRLDPKEINCYENSSGRITAEVVLPFRRMERVDKAELAVSMGELCDRDFELPEVEACGESSVRLRFREMPSFQLITGAAQICVSHSRICGDSCNTFQDGEKHAAMLISDGMGTGSRAAMDSAMASGLLSRLLCAGIGPAASLKLVNGALLVKSEDESLATVDLVSVDLYTGKAEFFKAGAAPTFLRRGGHAGSVEAASLPAGILNNVAFEHAAVALRDGDIIVMVSDGAIQNGGDWILEELENYRGRDPDWLAEHLAKCAKARVQDGREDDITVLAGMVVQA